MKYKYLLLFSFFFIQNINAQNSQWENSVSNTSIKGWNDWENFISETTLRGRLSYNGDNSFVKLFNIKTVEKLSIYIKSDKHPDTISQYLVEYDTNGLLRRIKDRGSETIFNYDSCFNFVSSDTEYSALIEKIEDVEILPNIELRLFSPSHLKSKEFYLNKGDKPYKLFRYFYSNNLLLYRIVIKEMKTPQKEIFFKYTYFK
jgi:hypothetical protein